VRAFYTSAGIQFTLISNKNVQYHSTVLGVLGIEVFMDSELCVNNNLRITRKNFHPGQLSAKLVLALRVGQQIYLIHCSVPDSLTLQIDLIMYRTTEGVGTKTTK
jgi:hypothetical protein